jgi:hypothetical protein
LSCNACHGVDLRDVFVSRIVSSLRKDTIVVLPIKRSIVTSRQSCMPKKPPCHARPVKYQADAEITIPENLIF